MSALLVRLAPSYPVSTHPPSTAPTTSGVHSHQQTPRPRLEHYLQCLHPQTSAETYDLVSASIMANPKASVTFHWPSGACSIRTRKTTVPASSKSIPGIAQLQAKLGCLSPIHRLLSSSPHPQITCMPSDLFADGGSDNGA